MTQFEREHLLESLMRSISSIHGVCGRCITGPDATFFTAIRADEYHGLFGDLLCDWISDSEFLIRVSM